MTTLDTLQDLAICAALLVSLPVVVVVGLVRWTKVSVIHITGN